MVAPELVRGTSRGVTLLGDPIRPGGVTLTFTERVGGVSAGCYESLNLGSRVGDDPDSVRENRRRALVAVGAGSLQDRLVCPNQVHGDRVVVVGGDCLTVEEAQGEVAKGCDAVVCLEPNVPVLLCYADCVPVVLAAEGGFAVIHSGWKGTRARISGKALRVLVQKTGCDSAQVRAYIGPHIGVEDYEVSEELANTFAEEFGSGVIAGERNLDLAAAIRATLEEEGVPPASIACVRESTASHTDRFFSYRAQGGSCGRHGALAWMSDDPAKLDGDWLQQRA